ncbi:MFS transporter [Streptomyces sp. A0592]|uniref:MFS transporter n=1 Tax=Streptomyces sp. A0592 TaxID=2563099 RepID=UPI00109E8A5A|nr:MFS transporter [Streptomyces sp. A0592]THA86183.1 MFS transporter [Streptomyces sp. A0592]
MSLLHNPGFRLFWGAQTVSMVGTNMTRVAIPLLAASTLSATPFQMGLLQAAQTIAFLLVGLPAGVLVDRSRRRPILIICDLLRAVLMAAIVIGFLLDLVTFTRLLAVTLLVGLATAFFEIAYQSYIPVVVGRENLIEGNARLESTNAVSRLAGPTLGGGLVQLAGAVATVSVQAATHVLSALLLSRISTPEATPERTEQRRMGAEIREGLRFVLRDPVFRAITGSAATYNFFYAVSLPLVMLLLVEEMGLSGTAVGLLMAVSGVGGVLGAAFAGRLGRRFGQVRTMWTSYLLTVPTALLIPFAESGWQSLLFAAPWFTMSFGIVVYNVGQVSIRQQLCPPELLGRMNASVRFLVWGILPLGSVTGGALGEWLGVRGALLIGGIGMSTGVLWLVLSRLRPLRDLPAPAPSPSADGTTLRA